MQKITYFNNYFELSTTIWVTYIIIQFEFKKTFNDDSKTKSLTIVTTNKTNAYNILYDKLTTERKYLIIITFQKW